MTTDLRLTWLCRVLFGKGILTLFAWELRWGV